MTTLLDANQPRTNYRWVIAGLLFFATTINYLDRQVISLLKPLLTTEFTWTESDYAGIVTTFTLAYGISTLLAGYFIDRIGTKIGYTVSIAVWSVAAMVHALAGGTSGFMVARALLGIGESGNFPASIKTVAEWFPKRERAFATGLFNSGANIGAVVAPAVVPALALAVGWRWTFIITGLLGFVWIIFWWFYYEVPARHQRVGKAELDHILSDPITADDVAPEKPENWRAVFRKRAIWGFMCGKLFTDPIWWFFLFWLPAYLSDIYHLDLKKLGGPLILIYLAATVGSVGGGWLSSWLVSRGFSPTRARQSAMLLFAVCVLPVMALGQLNQIGPVIAILSLAVAAHQAWSANVFTVASDVFPKRSLSLVVGFGTMAGTLGGSVFPLIVGRVLDYYKGLGQLSAGYTVIFNIASLAYLVAWGLLYVFVFGPAGRKEAIGK